MKFKFIARDKITDPRAEFANFVCDKLGVVDLKTLEKAIPDIKKVQEHFKENVRNIYELVHNKIPMFAYGDLMTLGAENWGVTSSEHAENIRISQEAVLAYHVKPIPSKESPLTLLKKFFREESEETIKAVFSDKEGSQKLEIGEDVVKFTYKGKSEKFNGTELDTGNCIHEECGKDFPLKEFLLVNATETVGTISKILVDEGDVGEDLDVISLMREFENRNLNCSISYQRVNDLSLEIYTGYKSNYQSYFYTDGHVEFGTLIRAGVDFLEQHDSTTK